VFINFKIVLVETSHLGNIGGVARAMKNMRFSQLCLVLPKTFPSAEATARAAGSDDILASAVVFDSLAEAVADLATMNQMELFYQHLQQTLADIGFLHQDKSRSIMRRL